MPHVGAPKRRAFLIDHLVRWLPSFAEKLARVMPDSSYLQAAEVARAVTADDLSVIDAFAAAPTPS